MFQFALNMRDLGQDNYNPLVPVNNNWSILFQPLLSRNVLLKSTEHLIQLKPLHMNFEKTASKANNTKPAKQRKVKTTGNMLERNLKNN